MTNQDHLEARRVAQEIAKLARHIRFLRKKGKLSEAEAALTTFQTERVTVLRSGVWWQWVELRDELRGGSFKNSLRQYRWGTQKSSPTQVAHRR